MMAHPRPLWHDMLRRQRRSLWHDSRKCSTVAGKTKVSTRNKKQAYADQLGECPLVHIEMLRVELVATKQDDPPAHALVKTYTQKLDGVAPTVNSIMVDLGPPENVLEGIVVA